VSTITRYFLYVLIAFSVVAGSCSGRKNKAVHKDIIPEKDLISILADVHLADGLLSIPEIKYKFYRGDTLSSYIEIIEQYGYTKPQMDRTIRYYFIRKPKKLVKIYDKVLGRLSELESRVEKEYSAFIKEGLNIWPGKPYYLYPCPDREGSTWFDFPLNYNGPCYLKFTVTVFPDDQSVNPRLDLYLSHSDTAGNEKRSYFSALPYIKDGLPHTYLSYLNPALPPPVRLKGWFMNLKGTAPFREKHFRVENIILSRNRPE
jgi:hypothetical protein